LIAPLVIPRETTRKRDLVPWRIAFGEISSEG
jgi:hypothetical protein